MISGTKGYENDLAKTRKEEVIQVPARALSSAQEIW